MDSRSRRYQAYLDKQNARKSGHDAPKKDRPLSVGELALRIQRLIETEVGRVRVEGEISNLSIPRSGHAYFALKDSVATINAVCFKSTFQSLSTDLADGKQIEVYGRVTAYTARSQYQIIVEGVREAGMGDLMRRFIELRNRLQNEGLFDADRKKEIPRLPRRIGVVTSATGAALRDILNVLNRRASGLEIIVSPCLVQGAGAARAIAKAIARVDKANCDVIICGRGGGSIEDLWAFNEEPVVRAIAKCKTPIVSAVGHEVDTTLSDYAADLRAATPSAAAELVSQNFEELARTVSTLARGLDRAMRLNLESARGHLTNLKQSWGMRRPLDQMQQAMQKLDALSARLERTPAFFFRDAEEQLAAVRSRLENVRPDRRIQTLRLELGNMQQRLAAVGPEVRVQPRIDRARAHTEEMDRELSRNVDRVIRENRNRIAQLAQRIESLDPDAVLRRGYSIITTMSGRKIITSPEQVHPNQTVKIKSAGGEWRAAAIKNEAELFDVIQGEE